MAEVKLHTVQHRSHKAWQLSWKASDGRHRKIIGKVKDMGAREAKAIQREQQAAFTKGTKKATRAPRMTLRELLERDRDAIAVDSSPGTVVEQRLASNHAIAALGADTKANSMARDDVGRIKLYLANLGRSKATIRKTICTLRAAFYRALASGWIDQNPFKNAKIGKAQAKTMRIFEADEIQALYDSCPNDWWLALLRIAFETGLRRNEILTLTWADVDFDRCAVKVSGKSAGRFTAYGQSYPILPFDTKTHETRAVPTLTDETIALLQRMKRASDGSRYVFLTLQRLAKLDARTLGPKADLVNNLLKRFKALQRRAHTLLAMRQGVELGKLDWPEGCLHGCRRTFGTHTADLVPMHVLQKYMGHADIKTTATYYLAANDAHAERVRKAFSANKQPTQAGLADTDTVEDDKKPASSYDQVA